MRYSLLSRFQGTLLGAALGENLGNYGQTQLQTGRSMSGLERGKWIVEPASLPGGWGRVAVAAAEDLIHGGLTDGRDTELGLPAASLPRGATGLAIAALPIALFFHENPEKLHEHLGKLVTRWGGDSDLYSGVLTVGHTIALALQERLHPLQLIPQLLSDLDLPARSPNLANQLRQVQASVEQRIGLSAAIEQLAAYPPADLPIAFYCFLSTPEDYSLTIRRCAIGATLAGATLATAGLSDPIGTIAIAGALSGVYNSQTGIPLDWRRLLNHSTPDSPLVKLWNLESAEQIDRLAGAMLAVWAGMYQPIAAVLPNSMVSERALPIAATRVIRPR